MAITYPGNCNTPAKRTEWLYAAQELLRHIHSLFARWKKNTITQAQYDNPPLPNVPSALKPAVHRTFTYLKNKYPFKEQLTQEDWRQFKTEDFDLRQRQVIEAILTQRTLLKNSTAWDVKVEEI